MMRILLNAFDNKSFGSRQVFFKKYRETITDADYAYDQALLVNTPAQAEFLYHTHDIRMCVKWTYNVHTYIYIYIYIYIR